MTAVPKPSATWGSWRRQPIKVAGHNIIPERVTQHDRQVIRTRRDKPQHHANRTDNARTDN
jgi:hypothetical protein